MNEPLICLMGPTASGKSSLALQLARRFPVEIVSVDSALVYREMDIGTAKPTLTERRQVVHHGIDLINPDETYSAARFCEQVAEWLPAIRQRNKIPLLVGGTMMYFKALQQGLAPLPAANAVLRQQLDEEGRKLGWPAMHARLQQLDPPTAARLDAHDQQRIQRALEVCMLTGRPLSELQQTEGEAIADRFVNIMLIPAERQWLHQRIARRFDAMIEQGFLKEVEELINRWPTALTKPSMRMVGYRQAMDYFSHGDFPLFREKAIAATRQLAKRQLTWLRHWPQATTLHPDQDDILARCMELIDQ